MTLDISSHLSELVELRHHLHSIAEVSGSESDTAQYIQEFLQEEATPDQMETGIGGNGLAAIYESDAEGPHIMLRCELDGLPIADKIEADHQSNTRGVGHKCGHDGHMSIICGVAKVLSHERPSAGKISLLFQPAEETGQGAQRVLDDEKFSKLQPDYCFALHNLPGYTKNQIIIREGPFAAASVGLEVTLEGETSHAAHPEEGKSPALAMAQLVESLSAVPQLYSSLDQAAKVTVINAELGEEAFGTSPGHAVVRATLRTYDDEHLESLKKRCRTLAEGLAETYEVSISHRWVEEFAATKNNANATNIIQKAASENGFDLLKKEHPFSWSEDFGRFTKEITGAMFGLGIGKEHSALHAESYDFDDDIIPTGVQMFIQITKEILENE